MGLALRCNSKVEAVSGRYWPTGVGRIGRRSVRDGLLI